MIINRESILIKLFILTLFIFYYLVLPALHPLWVPDETHIAEISREMIVSRNWLEPHFLGAPFADKRIAGFWINALGQLLFGHTLFAVRFSSVLCIVLSVILFYRLALRMWNDRYTAMMACVIFLTSVLVYQRSSHASLEPMLTFCLVATMSGCWMTMYGATPLKRYLAWGVVAGACSLGWLAGGAVAVIVPLLSLLPWCWHQRRLRMLSIFAVLILFIMSVMWKMMGGIEPSSLWTDNYTANDTTAYPVSFWNGIFLILCGSLPWAALLPGACCAAWRARDQHTGDFYLLSWVTAPLLYFALMRGGAHMLSLYAPLALLVARYAVRLSSCAPGILRVNGWINLILGLLLACAAGFYLFPLSLNDKAVYGVLEVGKVMLIITALLGWSMTGAIALLPSPRGWVVAAFCPLALALIAEPSVPEGMAYAVQPHKFISQVGASLRQSRFILTDDVSLASGLAWELQRSNIILYGDSGVAEPDSTREAAVSRVSPDAFPRWLTAHRYQGNITVLLRTSHAQAGSSVPLPEPDTRFQVGHQVAYFYKKTL